jgi:hypothetical protein
MLEIFANGHIKKFEKKKTLQLASHFVYLFLVWSFKFNISKFLGVECGLVVYFTIINSSLTL